jgi:hypothetical protein
VTTPRSAIISDQTFADTDWTSTKYIDTTVGHTASYTATQVSSGGHTGVNPDPCWYMTDTYTYGKIGVVSIYNPFAYNPGTEGAIETIDYSYDGKMERLTANRAVGSYMVLMQGGVAFESASNLLLSTNWATFHQESLGATDWTNPTGNGPLHPDFSAGGGVVTVGIEVWNSMITSEQLTNYSMVDDLSLELTHGVSAPEPITVTLLAIGGLLINRRRSK